jgi:hypothetical protein
MMPGKVIPISEARRRLPAKVKPKAKTRKPQSDVWQRVKAWLSSRTTNGAVLLVGVLAGMVLGAMVAAATQPSPQQVPPAPADYSQGP